MQNIIIQLNETRRHILPNTNNCVRGALGQLQGASTICRDPVMMTVTLQRTDIWVMTEMNQAGPPTRVTSLQWRKLVYFSIKILANTNTELCVY